MHGEVVLLSGVLFSPGLGSRPRHCFSTLKNRNSRLSVSDSELLRKLKARLRAEEQEESKKQADLVELLENGAVLFNTDIVHDTGTFTSMKDRNQ